MRDVLGFVCMPIRWALSKAWDLMRGYDSDAEYQHILDDLRADLLRRGEGR